MYFVKSLDEQEESEKHGAINWGALWRTLDFQELINVRMTWKP